jgi:hypothetical protein
MTPNGHSETDGIRGHKIEYKFEFCWLFNRNLPASPRDPIDIICSRRQERSKICAAGNDCHFLGEARAQNSEIGDELEFDRLHYRKFIGLFALECFTDKAGGFVSYEPSFANGYCQVGNQHLERDAVCAYGYNHAVQSEMLELYA